MKRAIITRRAQADLDEIADYVAENNPKRAITFTREIIGHCHRLGNTPHVGRSRPNLGPGIRSIPHGRYMIFYRMVDSDVQILRVLHSARDIEALF
jgi:toxin ParE1/3/4